MVLKKLKPYIISVAIIAAIGSCVGAYFFGVDVTNTKWEAKTQQSINAAVEEARKNEKTKQKQINKVLRTQVSILNNINGKLKSDIAGLRNRASRRDMSDNTRAECKGVDGRSLSREDSEFLTREAARADELRVALKACYEYADVIGEYNGSN